MRTSAELGTGRLMPNHCSPSTTLELVSSVSNNSANRHTLEKVLQNSTTISNNYHIFPQIDRHPARKTSPEASREGEKLRMSTGNIAASVDGTPEIQRWTLAGARGFGPLADPNDNNRQVFSFNQNFDWRALLLHRRRLN